MHESTNVLFLPIEIDQLNDVVQTKGRELEKAHKVYIVSLSHSTHPVPAIC